MRLLRLSLETQRHDLAAHVLVHAAAVVLKNGDKPDDKKSKTSQGCPEGQSER